MLFYPVLQGISIETYILIISWRIDNNKCYILNGRKNVSRTNNLQGRLQTFMVAPLSFTNCFVRDVHMEDITNIYC